ncbi:hypothetical protein [Sphingomonas sp.]|uniref:hypothetical protein n=1 Tax=Sphingomonas sp. TaxID=28214 RepID=UPI0035C83707
MTGAAEAVEMVIRGGRGIRPTSLNDAETEKVLCMALALLVELTTAQERIDRLEREVASLRGISLAAWKEADVPEEIRHEQAEQAEALQLRVLRPLIDPRHSQGA